MRRRALLLALLATAAAPAPPQAGPIDNLLAALKAAPTEPAAAALEGQLRAQWAHAATPAVGLLLSRGSREMSENNASDAFESFDAALDLSPDLLEGWRGRAQARRALGDTTGATRDIGELLRREPRSFLAFQDLSRMAEGRRDWRGALSAWQQVLILSPRTPGGQDRLRDLQRRALGEQL